MVENMLASPLLKKWMNPLYLQEATAQELQASFQAQQPKYLHLQRFLLPQKAKTMLQHLQRLKYQQVYKPDRYRYSVASPAAESCKPFSQFLASTAMQIYLQKLTGEKIHACVQEIVSFQRQDYALLHDEERLPQGIRFVVDLTQQWNAEAGGYQVYTLPEHDPLIIYPAFNTLTLIASTKDLRCFAKYSNSVSNARKQYRVQGVYQGKRL